MVAKKNVFQAIETSSPPEYLGIADGIHGYKTVQSGCRNWTPLTQTTGKAGLKEQLKTPSFCIVLVQKKRTGICYLEHIL